MWGVATLWSQWFSERRKGLWHLAKVHQKSRGTLVPLSALKSRKGPFISTICLWLGNMFPVRYKAEKK